MKKLRIAILFDHFGPYHLVRLKACAEVVDLLGVEFGASSSEYSWERIRTSDFKSVTLNPNGPSEELSRGEFESRLDVALRDFSPDAVAIPGWGSSGALLGLAWCLKNKVPAVLMSDSTEWDHRRTFIREWIKSRIVNCYSAALVAGSPHKGYLAILGFPQDRISLGYDVVDNDFFRSRSEIIRRETSETRTANPPIKYFLASARFIEKKNLQFLIQSYSEYRRSAVSLEDGNPPWDLVILGDGPLFESVISLRRDLGLEKCFHLPGFKQYEELPAFYGRAGAFIHASTTEQWGLVVNEAMACGLPVLVSDRCGCASDLVRHAENGFTFDPYNVESLAGLMQKVSASNFPLEEYGSASRRIVADWGPARFVSGLKNAGDKALSVGTSHMSWLDRTVLRVSMYR